MSLKFFKKFSFAHSVEVFQNSIVIHNFKLIIWENYCHKVVEFLFSCIVRFLSPSLKSNPCSSSGSVVSISNIECRNFRKELGNFSNQSLIIDHSEMMSKSVICHEIIFRFLIFYDFFNDAIKLCLCWIGKEYRFYICIGNVYMDHSIVLLVSTREFVLFNALIEIIINAGAGYESILGSFTHRLPVDIDFWFSILNKPSFILECFEILHDLVVYGLRMLISPFWKVNFCLGNMKERILIACSFLSRFS